MSLSCLRRNASDNVLEFNDFCVCVLSFFFVFCLNVLAFHNIQKHSVCCWSLAYCRLLLGNEMNGDVCLQSEQPTYTNTNQMTMRGFIMNSALLAIYLDALYTESLSFVFITGQCKWRMTNLVKKLSILSSCVGRCQV